MSNKLIYIKELMYKVFYFIAVFNFIICPSLTYASSSIDEQQPSLKKLKISYILNENTALDVKSTYEKSSGTIQDIHYPNLIQIFSNLELNDLKNVSLVNKCWLNIVNQNHFWHQYLINIFPYFEQKYDFNKNYKDIYQFYHTPSFILLPHCEDITMSYAKAISSDGKYIVGECENNENEYSIPFLFDCDNNNFRKISDQPGVAISVNENFIIGNTYSLEDSGSNRTFKFDIKNNQLDYIDHFNEDSKLIPIKINKNNTIIGHFKCDAAHQYLASFIEKSHSLNYKSAIADKNHHNIIQSIDQSDKYAVGYIERLNNDSTEAYLYDIQNDRLTYFGVKSIATQISADGNIITGCLSNDQDKMKAYRYLRNVNKIILLDDSPNIDSTEVDAVNADGTTIIGRLQKKNSNDINAFIWRQEFGMQNLYDALCNLLPHHSILKDVKFTLGDSGVVESVYDIDHTGCIISGTVYYKDQARAFRAVIPRSFKIT